MQRMGMVIGVKADKIAEYKELHSNVWPSVLDRLSRSHIRNYSIFLNEPEGLLFGYWEYHGDDFDADAARIAEDPETQKWWTLCAPCQEPLPTRKKAEFWSMMEEVFHLD